MYGVTHYKRTNKHIAQVKKNNTKIHLGYYDTENEASYAVNVAIGLLDLNTNNINEFVILDDKKKMIIAERVYHKLNTMKLKKLID